MNNLDNDFKKDPLGGFINFINSKNNIKKQDVVFGRGVTSNQNRLLFQILKGSLIARNQTRTFLTLIGNHLTVENSSKNLTYEEMSLLYSFIEARNSDGTIKYFGFKDINITDGASYSIYIDWNNINFQENGGHTMATGLIEIIDYCKKIISK